MLKLKRGNLLDEKTEALVNPVNCVGVMGKGVALQFKRAFPENFKQYQKACKSNEVDPGCMFTVATDSLLNPRYIINFPTKRHWKQPSQLDDIKAGLAALVADVQRLGIRSIAIPPLGCGNGGLDWADVKPLIIDAFRPLPTVEVIVFEPAGAPPVEAMAIATSKPPMTAFRASLIRILELYGLPGYSASRIEIQKLAYFLKVAGEPTLQTLIYQRFRYGPYAHNLGHALQGMEGHYIRGYGDGSDRAQIQVLPEGYKAAQRFLAESQKADPYLNRVSQLIEGFETPYGLEMLATLHWIAQEDPQAAVDCEIAIARVQEWSDRKKNLFKSQHLAMAWSHLKAQGWLG
ncbi:macro domain-containing protein [Nodosilinea sp. E11]|uniref:type II toxin-antitoxin system antitoxin DNA ADP-ribosyl glycohydrolase DarG n=1 Tax=Nodosilinea sp. E11 TaxID=3037479 RepID=UPI002934E6F4|nr:macro domain-containing protein [Nodosilinea sp. E11]WOD36915.1 macro domain-containing protein [Nodosilinea sp. E11]